MATEICTQCDGGGEVAWNPSHIGDPQDVMTARCPTCLGEGEVEVAERGPIPPPWAELGRVRP